MILTKKKKKMNLNQYQQQNLRKVVNLMETLTNIVWDLQVFWAPKFERVALLYPFKRTRYELKLLEDIIAGIPIFSLVGDVCSIFLLSSIFFRAVSYNSSHKTL